MPDLAKIAAVETKMNAEAEPAPEGAAAPPPDGGVSEADSAPARPAGEGAPSTPDDPAGARVATIDHAALKEKLERDRARREERARRRKLEEDAAAAKKAREEAEAEKAKYANLEGKPYLERIKALGLDPLKTFEEMRAEALKAGTPEAKLEAMDRAWQARFEAMNKQLEDERKAREETQKTAAEERRRAQEQANQHAFVREFETGLRDPKYESLTDEYEPTQLLGIATRLRDQPDLFFQQATDLGVSLTSDDGTFTMGDILGVLKATQDRHFKRLEEQRRKRTAATQTSQASPQQPPEATRPTVNGTAERNAGSALGHQLAATRAAEPATRKESREERVKRLGSRYG